MPNFGNASFEFSRRSRHAFWAHLKKHPDHRYNVLIIGGGVVGAGLLREFVLRDIPDVFLVEKSDFASGTSGASSKLIHAGIRYLEQAWDHLKKGRFQDTWRNVRFVWQASRERKILGELAPHLIKPKPIYLVLGEKDTRSTVSVFLGVWFYYGIQLLQGQFFPPPRLVIRKSALGWVAPELDSSQVKALLSFWDSETEDARLVIEALQWSAREGGQALNYVEVVSLKKDKDHWRVELKNHDNQESLWVRARTVINAAGPFIDDVRRLGWPAPVPPLVHRVAGAHLDIYPALTNESYYVTAGDGRLVFVLKRNEDGLTYTRVGTTERVLQPDEDPTTLEPTQDELDYLESLVRSFFPKASFQPDHMLRVDYGVRPLTAQESATAFQKSREHLIHEEDGLYHMVGVKLTDFRRVAVELMNRFPWKDLGLTPNPTATLTSELVPFREENHPSSDLYAEKSPEDFFHQTMVIRWEDYYNRRHGLKPRFLSRFQPQELEAFRKKLASFL